MTGLSEKKDQELENLSVLVENKDNEISTLNEQLEELKKEKNELIKKKNEVISLDTKKDEEIERLSALVMDKDVELISQKTRMELDYLDKLKKLHQTCGNLEKERNQLMKNIDELTKLTKEKDKELDSLRIKLKGTAE